ncbi:MAG: hypothetical protein V4850_16340 [Myxococcota bacterium]
MKIPFAALLALSFAITPVRALGSTGDTIGGITVGKPVATSALPQDSEGVPFTETSVAGEAGRLLIEMCGKNVQRLSFYIVYLRNYWTEHAVPPAIRTSAYWGFTGHQRDALLLYRKLTTALREAGWEASRSNKNGKGENLSFAKDGYQRQLYLTKSFKYSRIDLVAEADRACTTGL